MSDVGWGSDHLEPPKKRKIPLWLMGCAGGCMFALGAGAVALYFGSVWLDRWVEVKNKPEVQWPKLAEVLPFDEQPAEFSIASWPIPFIDLWILDSPSRDLTVFVLSAGDHGASEAWGQWFDSPAEAPMFSVSEDEFETTPGQLVLQGRELRSVRIARKSSAGAPPPVPAPATPPNETDPGSFEELANSTLLRGQSLHGDGLALDVTPEGSDGRVLIWMMRVTAGATVSDEEAVKILAPFKIGPTR